MRILKTVAILAALAAFAMPAQAITFSQSYSGPIVLHLSSADWGTLYTGDADGYTWNGSTWVPDHAGNVLLSASAPGAVTGEDSYGYFSIDQIRTSTVTTPHEKIASIGGTPLWNEGDNGKELYGVFWAEKDTRVVLNADGSFSVEGSGFSFAIYEQDAGTFAANYPVNSPANSANRVGPDPWDYTGIGDDASSVLWATGVGQTGFAGTLASTVFTSSYNPDITQISAGQGNVKLSIEEFAAGDGPTGTGVFNSYLDSNWFIAPGGETADVNMQFTTYLNNPTNGATSLTASDATVLDSDPATTFLVPEPLTMLGLTLGIGGIGGYLRRRTRVA